MAMPAEDFTGNDEPATRGDITALHQEVHEALEILRAANKELQKFLNNPAMRWRSRKP